MWRKGVRNRYLQHAYTWKRFLTPFLCVIEGKLAVTYTPSTSINLLLLNVRDNKKAFK